MKRTGSFKLSTTPQQTEAFSVLARLFSDACNEMVPFVQEHRCWNRVALHHLVYYRVRETFPALGSQMVCQAIHRVADTYKTLRVKEGIPKDQPVPAIKFTPSSVSFDHRTYSIKGKAFALFTTTGRAKVGFACGPLQKELLVTGIMEDLTHIRAHIKAGIRVRARLHRWAFRQLQDFVQYKAEAAGLKVEYVDPAYTSQTCSVCGGLGKRVKHRFACSCGNLAHSDVNASRNIARFAKLSSSARGVVSRPEFAHRVRPRVVESSFL
jgi:IS605 OrfB family transposase